MKINTHGKEDLNRIYEMQDIHKTGWVTYDEMGSTLCAFGTFVCASETKKVARWISYHSWLDAPSLQYSLVFVVPVVITDK